MGNDQAHGSDTVLSEAQLAAMSYDAVIGHVQANLSGDFARDGALIVAIGRACEGHPQALEIRRELGRMLHGIAPAEMIEQVDRMANEDVSALDEGLARAKALVSGGDVAGGRRAVEELLGPYGNDNGTFADDAVSEYRRFANPLEEALYVARDRPTRTVRRIPYDRVALYLLYGYILLEQREMAAAETALREALRLNPVSTIVMFELAEVLKMTGRHAEFRELTIRALEVAYSNEVAARAFRNLGFLAIEERHHDMAVACFGMSLLLDPKNATMAQSELFYLQQSSGRQVRVPDEATLIARLEAAGLHVGPSPLVTRVMNSNHVN